MPISIGLGAGILFEGDDTLTAYGFMYTTDGSTAQGSIGDPVKLEGFDGDSPSFGVTVDAENSKMTIVSPGIYQVDGQFSFSGTPNTTFEFSIHVNGEITSLRFDRTIGAGGDVGSGSFDGLLELSVGDVVEPYVLAEGVMKEITLIHAQLLLHSL